MSDAVIEAMARAHHDARYGQQLPFDAMTDRAKAEVVALMRAALRAAEAAGWRLVPVEATERARGIGAACIAGGLAEVRTYGQIADDVCRAMLAAALSRLSTDNKALREALEGLIAAVVRDSAEHGISGYTGARLSDARSALARAVEQEETG